MAITDRRPAARVWLGYGVAAGAVGYGIASSGLDWQEARSAAQFISIWTCLAAFLAFLAHTSINAIAFGVLLQGGSRNPVSLRAGAVSWAVSVTAKYVPGGIWHVVARGVLLARLGVGARMVAMTGVAEQLLSLFWTLGLAVVFLCAAGVLGSDVASALLASGAVLLCGVGWFLGGWGGIDRRRLAVSGALYLVAMAPFALGYLVLINPDRPFDLVGWLFAGTAGGTLAVIVPGGLGVREAILVQPIPGGSAAAVMTAALVARSLILLGELVISVAASAILLRSRDQSRSLSGRGAASVPEHREVRAIGVGLRGSGYPNAAGWMRCVASIPGWSVVDRVSWLGPDVHLWKVAKGPLRQRLRVISALAWGGLASAWSAVRDRAPLCYAPYPSVFVLWWLSWLPRRRRPVVIADAYISLWDSMYRDRGAGSATIAARCLLAYEARALRAADQVLVDTEANRAWMVPALGLDPARVHSVPLAADVEKATALPALVPPMTGEPLRVLFVGTLIPLHGLRVIADAARQLGANSGVIFEIIGEGQEAPVLEELIAESVRAPVAWSRGWHDLEYITQRMESAHVCLGVFGGHGKAARVLPFKAYLALAGGRPIVTQLGHSLPGSIPDPPWTPVAPTGGELAKALLGLRRDPDRLVRLGTDSRAYFDAHLSSRSIRARWLEIIREIRSEPGSTSWTGRMS